MQKIVSFQDAETANNLILLQLMSKNREFLTLKLEFFTEALEVRFITWLVKSREIAERVWRQQTRNWIQVEKQNWSWFEKKSSSALPKNRS